MIRLILIIGLIIPCFIEARSRAPKMELSAGVVSKLDIILEKTDEFRVALINKQESLIIVSLRELEQALSEALRATDTNSQNKQHLDRILNEALQDLGQTSATKGEVRKSKLQNAFKQIVLIGQTYKVSEKYKFYFCRKDRSVWLQKDSKPQNPINPQYTKCGVRVE